jgi:hypothetical protein
VEPEGTITPLPAASTGSGEGGVGWGQEMQHSLLLNLPASSNLLSQQEQARFKAFQTRLSRLANSEPYSMLPMGPAAVLLLVVHTCLA